MKIKVYGSRGSTAYVGPGNRIHGGNTACVLLETNGKRIVFDGGTGILGLGKDLQNEPGGVKLDILISHLHVDHIVGLPAFTPLYDPQNDIRIMTKSRIEDVPLDKQIFGPFKPPYWPVDMSVLNQSECVELKVDEPFDLGGDVKVITFASPHPDDAVAFRVEAEKTIVYLCDCELKDDSLIEYVSKYCKDADCVIFDTAYMPFDYPPKNGWGHSTYEIGIKLAERSNCKKLILTHFDLAYDDALLTALAERLAKISDMYTIAYDGLEVDI